MSLHDKSKYVCPYCGSFFTRIRNLRNIFVNILNHVRSEVRGRDEPRA